MLWFFFFGEERGRPWLFLLTGRFLFRHSILLSVGSGGCLLTAAVLFRFRFFKNLLFVLNQTRPLCINYEFIVWPGLGIFYGSTILDHWWKKLYVLAYLDIYVCWHSIFVIIKTSHDLFWYFAVKYYLAFCYCFSKMHIFPT